MQEIITTGKFRLSDNIHIEYIPRWTSPPSFTPASTLVSLQKLERNLITFYLLNLNISWTTSLGGLYRADSKSLNFCFALLIIQNMHK